MGSAPNADPLGALVQRGRRARLDREATDALRRRIQATIFEDIADTSIDYGTPHPGGFLAQLVAGYDPRPGASVVAQILDGIRARGAGALPTQAEWDTLADMIDNSPLVRGEYVDLETSRKAAEKLLPYLYAPSKSDAVSAEGESSIAVVSPLSVEEIETFAEFWSDEY